MLQTGIAVFLETGFLFLPQFRSDECSINPINRSINQSSSCKVQNFPNLGFTKHVSTSLTKLTYFISHPNSGFFFNTTDSKLALRRLLFTSCKGSNFSVTLRRVREASGMSDPSRRQNKPKWQLSYPVICSSSEIPPFQLPEAWKRYPFLA